jgi:hypothetical protein
MSTPYLMWRRRYSSPAAGGGVPGKDVGTAPDTMTEGGVITGEYQVFTDIFMLVGEMISGIIGGEGNRGNITGYITMILIAIGVTGTEPGTGIMEDLVGAVETVVGTVETVGMETVAGMVETVDMETAVGTAETVDEVVTAVGAAEEAVPAVVEVLPAVVEAVPVVAEAVPAVVEAVPVAADLVSVEENPVYNLVPIIRKMIRRTGQKITRQNVKQPHNNYDSGKNCQL